MKSLFSRVLDGIIRYFVFLFLHRTIHLVLRIGFISSVCLFSFVTVEVFCGSSIWLKEKKQLQVHLITVRWFLGNFMKMCLIETSYSKNWFMSITSSYIKISNAFTYWFSVGKKTLTVFASSFPEKPLSLLWSLLAASRALCKRASALVTDKTLFREPSGAAAGVDDESSMKLLPSVEVVSDISFPTLSSWVSATR